MRGSHSIDLRHALDIDDELGLRVFQCRSASVFEASHVSRAQASGNDDNR
jgi:hypothetical protein